MLKIYQMVSLSDTFVKNSKNEGQKNYLQTLENGYTGPLKFKYIRFILSNITLSVMSRKRMQRKDETSKENL